MEYIWSAFLIIYLELLFDNLRSFISIIYRAPFCDNLWSPFSINFMNLDNSDPIGSAYIPGPWQIYHMAPRISHFVIECPIDGLPYIVLITGRSKGWLKKEPVNPYRPIQMSDEAKWTTNRHLTLVVCYVTTTLHHDSRQHSANTTEHFRCAIHHPTMIVSITRTGWLRICMVAFQREPFVNNSSENGGRKCIHSSSIVPELHPTTT